MQWGLTRIRFYLKKSNQIFHILQESDAEKSDQELVVDVGEDSAGPAANINGDLSSPREKSKDLSTKKDERISPRSDASSHGSSTSHKHRDVRLFTNIHLFTYFYY